MVRFARISIAVAFAVFLATGCGAMSRHRIVVQGCCLVVVGKGHLVGAARSGGGAELDNGRRLMSGQVVVYDLRGRIVARQSIGPHGQNFNFALPPGRYRLGFGGRTPDQLGGCRPTIATVRQGRTTHQDVLVGCDWPVTS